MGTIHYRKKVKRLGLKASRERGEDGQGKACLILESTGRKRGGEIFPGAVFPKEDPSWRSLTHQTCTKFGRG